MSKELSAQVIRMYIYSSVVGAASSFGFFMFAFANPKEDTMEKVSNNETTTVSTNNNNNNTNNNNNNNNSGGG